MAREVLCPKPFMATDALPSSIINPRMPVLLDGCTAHGQKPTLILGFRIADMITHHGPSNVARLQGGAFWLCACFSSSAATLPAKGQEDTTLPLLGVSVDVAQTQLHGTSNDSLSIHGVRLESINTAACLRSHLFEASAVCRNGWASHFTAVTRG